MTIEEKRQKRKQRDADICAYYAAMGGTLQEVAETFAIGRQTVQQVLTTGGLWTPFQRSTRTKHLGVTITEEMKQTLEQEAERRNMSVSKLTAEVLEQFIAEAK